MAIAHQVAIGPSTGSFVLATLEFVRHAHRSVKVNEGLVRWESPSDSPIALLPQLVWNNHSTWAEANLWALDQSAENNISTVQRAMQHLLAYANWLESEELDWRYFPVKRADRCLIRFRGALIRSRDAGEVAPTTASQRMSTIVRFYRWLLSNGLMSASQDIWQGRSVGIPVGDPFGFEHTIRVASTDLCIRNTKIAGSLGLEEGLMPLTSEGMREVLEFSSSRASKELALMLKIGFSTGLRLGSICDLKVGTLEQVTTCPWTGWPQFEVGPAAQPPVATKFSTNGKVPIISVDLLEELRDYACSTRRLKRQSKSLPIHRDLIFLTRFGGSFSDQRSRALSMEMSRLRKAGAEAGVHVLRDFHFHRSRATFATMLMKAALKYLPVGDAVQIVREACLHKSESTTMKYVRFIEVNSAMSDVADAFSAAFFGMTSRSFS